MLTPAYKLTIGSKSVDSVHHADGSTLVELAVMLDMDTPADSFTLVLGEVGSLKPARNNAATIELGYADGSLNVRKMARAKALSGGKLGLRLAKNIERHLRRIQAGTLPKGLTTAERKALIKRKPLLLSPRPSHS